MGGVARVRRLLGERLNLAVLPLVLLACFALPNHLPAEVAGLGLVGGARYALQAIAVVLIFRSTRMINFAQVSVGLVGAMVAFLLNNHLTFLQPVIGLCGRCAFSGAWLWLNFVLSIAVGLIVGMLVSLLTYHLVIRRFDRAPRFILTVVTIALATVYNQIAGGILSTLNLDNPGPLNYPFRPFQLKIGVEYFNATDIITVLVTIVALVVLGAFFMRSRHGLSIRGAADNPQRAQTLGIDVGAVTSTAWMIAGLLSTIAAILLGQVSASGTAGDLSAGTTVRVLAAAVLAGMSSMPIAAIAAFVIGIANQAVLNSFSSPAYFEGALLVIICGFLLLQRSRSSRAEQDIAASWPAARESRPVPAELRDLSSVRAWRRGGLALGILAILAFPFVVPPSIVVGGAGVMIFGILAMSLLVLGGWAGQISMAQVALAGVGAYVAAILSGTVGLPFPLPLIAAAAAGAVVAFGVGIPALRIKGLFLAVSTLALSLVVSDLLLDTSQLGRFLPTGLQRPGFFGFNLDDDPTFYYFTVACLGLAFLAVMGVRRSRFARALIGSRDNEPAAQSFGVNIVWARLTAFAFSGALAGFAGSLLVFDEHGLNLITYTPDKSVTLFVLGVLGGFGSLAGPVLTTIVYLLSRNVQEIAGVVSGAGVIAVLMLWPGGLQQGFFQARDAVLRQIAIRRRIVVPSLLADFRRETRGSELPALGPAAKGAHVIERYRLHRQWKVDEVEVPSGS